LQDEPIALRDAMPRPRRSTLIGGEETLACRIAHERERRSWSYEALARHVTDAGVPVAGSALHRIEKGSPRRRVTVDELLALADVFEVSVEELLMPVELVRKERAQQVLKTINGTEEELLAATARYVEAWTELWELAGEDLELHEFVMNHLTGADGPGPDALPQMVVVEGGLGVDTTAFDQAFANFLTAAWYLAADAVEASLTTSEE
jgi:transcriptional regulator with XRE-family HTH domain